MIEAKDIITEEEIKKASLGLIKISELLILKIKEEEDKGNKDPYGTVKSELRKALIERNAIKLLPTMWRVVEVRRPEIIKVVK